MKLTFTIKENGKEKELILTLEQVKEILTQLSIIKNMVSLNGTHPLIFSTTHLPHPQPDFTCTIGE